MPFVSPGDRRRKGPVHRRFRPHLLALEDRCLLSTLWNNFPLPDPSSHVSSITGAPDGNVWFTDAGAHKIGRISPAGAITEFALASSSGPAHLTSGPDGSLWFTDTVLDEIARITVAGVITHYPLAGAGPAALAGGVPTEIVAGRDGNLWFTLANRSDLGRLSPSGSFADFDLGNVQPDNLTAGADGNIWFIDRLHRQIGRVTPAGTVAEFSLPSVAGSTPTPLDLTGGPDGNLWFTEGSTGSQIGRLTPTGTFTMFDLAAGHAAFGIQSGHDFSLWFTESGRMGRFNPFTGIMTEFLVPVDPPTRFTAGVDGNLWFANGDSISQLNHAALPPGTFVSIFLTGLSGSVHVSVAYGNLNGTTQFVSDLVIAWGDGQLSPRTLSSNAGPAPQFVADHFYAAAGQYAIRLSIAQSNGVFIQAILTPTEAAPGSKTSPGSSPAPPDVHDFSGGGGGFGGFDTSGQIPWISITNHPPPNPQASPEGTLAFPYATQSVEGLTSLPSSRAGGFILLISLQGPIGAGPVTNGYTAGQAAYSSGAGRTESAGEGALPVAARAVPSSSFTASGADEGAGSAAPSRAAAGYGSGREIGQPWSSGNPQETAVSSEVPLTQAGLDDPGLALVGEPLSGAVPRAQDLLAIAWEIVAADAQKQREPTKSWGWLEKSLVGAMLGVIAGESLLWSLHFTRRRQADYLVAANR